MWASLNTFSAASGDFANFAAVFSHTVKPEISKMGAKKQETFFLDFLFRIFANSGGYPVVIPRK